MFFQPLHYGFFSIRHFFERIPAAWSVSSSAQKKKKKLYFYYFKKGEKICWLSKLIFLWHAEPSTVVVVVVVVVVVAVVIHVVIAVVVFPTIKLFFSGFFADKNRLDFLRSDLEKQFAFLQKVFEMVRTLAQVAEPRTLDPRNSSSNPASELFDLAHFSDPSQSGYY